MHSLGKRAEGERLERMQVSPLWRDGGFRNLFPIAPGLRDLLVPVIPVQEFLAGSERCKPNVPLPSLDPLSEWTRTPCRAGTGPGRGQRPRCDLENLGHDRRPSYRSCHCRNRGA